jgi:hypothetical protein
MTWLQMQIGTDEVNHGTAKYTVNNKTWRVWVPQEVADFMLENGKSGASLIEIHPAATVCPHCGHHTFKED